MNTEIIDEGIARLDKIINKCSSPVLKKKYINERIRYGERKIAAIDELMLEAANNCASDLITESEANSIMEELEAEKFATQVKTIPYFEDASVASALATATKEVMEFTLKGSQMLVLIGRIGLGKPMSLPAAKWVKHRLAKYTLLHPQAIDAKDLKKKRFDLLEVDRYNFAFPMAKKWLEKGKSRIHVDVYFYRETPVFGIAYTKDVRVFNELTSLVETEFKDAGFKKDIDYYNAWMAAELQLGHPSIKRCLKDLSAEWKKKKEQLEKTVKESACEADIVGDLDERIHAVYESEEEERIQKDCAILYEATALRAALLDHPFRIETPEFGR